jgi:hypothetical protein
MSVASEPPERSETNVATLYRLYLGLSIPYTSELGKHVGSVPYEQAEAFIQQRLRKFDIPAATLIKGTGVWEGTPEEALIVEVIALGGSPIFELREIGTAFKEAYEQNAVLLTTQEISAEVI